MKGLKSLTRLCLASVTKKRKILDHYEQRINVRTIDDVISVNERAETKKWR